MMFDCSYDLLDLSYTFRNQLNDESVDSLCFHLDQIKNLVDLSTHLCIDYVSAFDIVSQLNQFIANPLDDFFRIMDFLFHQIPNDLIDHFDLNLQLFGCFS